jgi:glutamate-1-semialdehyde 2,1-aminomutase
MKAESQMLNGKRLAKRRSSRAVQHAVFSMRHSAARYLVGGVNSPVRAFRSVGAEPLLLIEGMGAEVVDAAGRRYVDFISGWGALILGHRHPSVERAIARTLKSDWLLGLTHPAEIELARRIADAVPSAERVRFTVSGTEACMTAVKLARAHTGRTTLLVFGGCYHGHGESLMAGKSAGLPASLASDTVTVPYNNIGAIEETFARAGGELACAIVEPAAANMGVVPPAKGFLERLRTLTSRHGTLLIFDEVVTGFRLGLGGAQAAFGLTPDLTTFGKIIGGGMPIGALAGPERLMRHLAPEGDVYHGGTFAGHPLSMAAGIAALEALAAHPPYERLERLARRAAEGLQEGARKAGVPVRVNRAGSMLTLFFANGPVRNQAEAKAASVERFTRWANGLRKRGVLIPPSPYEALFLSTAHTDAHIERLLAASRAAVAAIAG